MQKYQNIHINTEKEPETEPETETEEVADTENME